MYEVKISGFKTKAQAEEFVKWYEGSGEQQAEMWFECRKEEGVIDVSWMPTSCQDTYPLTWNGNVLPMVLRIGEDGEDD